MLASYKKSLSAAFVVVSSLAIALCAAAQSSGNSGSITGTVVDSTGAVVRNATVEIHNPVSGYDQTPRLIVTVLSVLPIFRSTRTT